MLALIALAAGAIGALTPLRWPALAIPLCAGAGILAVAAACLLLLAFRPPIEIHERHLMVGRRAIPWSEVQRLDQTRWSVPLAVHLTLAGDRRVLLVHAGDGPSCAALLRNLRRYSREALLDGIPYPQFWGEAPSARQLAAPRYRLLRAEDEAEIERMFQRLKTVGRPDHRPDREVETSDPE